MARSTTYHGLSDEALKFLKENAEFEEFQYTDKWDKVVSSKRPVMEKIEETCGMFDECDMFRYKLKSGSWAVEFVQASPWSGGPHEFIALKVDGKEIGLWPEKTIFDEI